MFEDRPGVKRNDFLSDMVFCKQKCPCIRVFISHSDSILVIPKIISLLDVCLKSSDLNGISTMIPSLANSNGVRRFLGTVSVPAVKNHKWFSTPHRPLFPRRTTSGDHLHFRLRTTIAHRLFSSPQKGKPLLAPATPKKSTPAATAPPPSTPSLPQSFALSFLGFGSIYLAFGVFLAAPHTVLVGFGASCALLYAAPAAPFSQPRCVVGGHSLATFVGVASNLSIHQMLAVIPETVCSSSTVLDFLSSHPEAVAAPLAVAASVVGMKVADCFHPPAGGTAAGMVLGSTALVDLGFQAMVPAAAGSSVLVALAAIGHGWKGIQYPVGGRWW